MGSIDLVYEYAAFRFLSAPASVGDQEAEGKASTRQIARMFSDMKYSTVPYYHNALLYHTQEPKGHQCCTAQKLPTRFDGDGGHHRFISLS